MAHCSVAGAQPVRVPAFIRSGERWLRRVVLWLLLPAAAAALPPDLEPPTVELAGVRVLEMTASRQTLGLSLRVHNPNLFDIPLRSLRYELSLDGEPLVHGDRQEPITLPGGGDELVEVRAVVSLGQLFEHLQSMVARGELGVDYRLKGEFRLGEGHATFPYDQRGRLDLDSLLPFEREAPPAPKPTYI